MKNREWEGVGFSLKVITIQSGRNVCGTKWSVMGIRQLQLHIEEEEAAEKAGTGTTK